MNLNRQAVGGEDHQAVMSVELCSCPDQEPRCRYLIEVQEQVTFVLGQWTATILQNEGRTEYFSAHFRADEVK